jgi:hypothetical protein
MTPGDAPRFDAYRRPADGVPRLADGTAGSSDGAFASPPPDGHNWMDSDAGPIVRAFTVTGGRAHPPVGAFDLMAFVVRNVSHDRGLFLQPEHRAILDRAERPVSVAELASFVDLAVGVVRVLLGDLLQQGLISMYEPPSGAHRPGEDVLKAVVNGLRSL